MKPVVVALIWLWSLVVTTTGSTGGSLVDPTNSILVTEPEIKTSSRKHKVHNLVLNPDKHSWCELKHIRQIVTHAHCTSKEMENYVCVGTCFSYTVPHTIPETPGDELLDYCDSCSASDSHWSTVTLDCEHDGVDYEIKKNIQMITNCSCSACQPPLRLNPISNDVTAHSTDHRISEIIHKMIPDSHKFKDNNALATDPNDQIDLVDNGGKLVDLTDDLRYTQVSLGDLKKEFNLDDKQQKRLHGKVLIKDKASFTDHANDDNGERGYISY